MYKSAYGAAFGRKENEIADTNVLKYRKFGEMQSTRVLNRTAKAFLTKWSELGEDPQYVSLAILAIKGIFTFWKQSIPAETVSHVKHAWYEPYEVLHNQRIDKVGKREIIEKIDRAAFARPQTTGNLLRKRQEKKRSQTAHKGRRKDRGLESVTENRKKFLLRGNGNITGFYDAPQGIVSTYQSSFKPCKSSLNLQRSAANMYVSSIMTVTPDPNIFLKEEQK